MDSALLSKFGVEIVLDIAKRMLSLKPKPGVDFQLHGRNFEKKLKNYTSQNFAVSGPVWMKFGRQMLNHMEKNSKYYCKKT